MKTRLGSPFRRVLSLVLGLLVALQVVSPSFAAEPDGVRIQILPIGQAKFLAGQKFDFRVEVSGFAGQVNDLKIFINDESARRAFGKELEVNLTADVPYAMVRDVSLDEAGMVDVDVIAIDNNGFHFTSGKWEVVEPLPLLHRAKNVILFVGDGLTVPMRTAARVLSKGLTEGKYNGWLEMDEMDVVGLVTTSGMDSIVTDSANSASAYATGHKTAVNAMGGYPDSTPDPNDDPRVENIVELVKRTRGMGTGIVSTANITDATPAAMLAHTRRRSEQNYIAEQMLEAERMPDVILGGGARQFLPQSVNGSRRQDDRNLIDEFKAAGYSFASTATEMKQVGNVEKLLGLFHLDNMSVYLDKANANPSVLGGFNDQPTLWDMTDTAINVLSQNPNGFFLMVEGASIDKQAHALDWERTVMDTIEFDKAIGVAKRFAEQVDPDTLIIVVADHSHGMSITGTYHELDGKTGREAVRVYGDAGWTTYEDKDRDGFPDSLETDVTLAIHWANHPDFRDDYKVDPVPTSPSVMANGVAVPNPQKDPNGELQIGNIPSNSTSGVHTMEDVPLTASGPGSQLLKGVYDNTEVFFAMVHALGLNPVKEQVNR